MEIGEFLLNIKQMRKRIKHLPRLVSSTRIPEISIGELARSNEKFKAAVKVKKVKVRPKIVFND
jgi:hypothetical protein